MTPEPSGPALRRWRERVEAVPPGVAYDHITRMAREGSRCEKARRWLRLGGQSAGPGAVFIYWHRRPGVALVVEGDRILTVMTRASGKARREEERRRRDWDGWTPRRPRREHDREDAT